MLRYHLILFLEGVVTFISPCLLPLIPVYVSYFTGKKGGRAETAVNASCFVAGFSLIFSLMGAFAGTLGALLVRYRFALNIVSGAVVVALGLNFLGILKFSVASPFRSKARAGSGDKTGPTASLMFGAAFAVLWTPCVGVFLGSALMMASRQNSPLGGFLMLLCYSAGLGVPFIASALLIDMLKSAFEFINKNHRVINALSGAILVILGVLMMTGFYGRQII